jgi:hypothetical protein
MSKYSVYNNANSKVAIITFQAEDDVAREALICSPSGRKIGYTERYVYPGSVKVFNKSDEGVGFGRVSIPESKYNIHNLISNFYKDNKDQLVGGMIDYINIREAKDLIYLVPSVIKGRIVKDDVSDLEKFIRKDAPRRGLQKGDERYIKEAINTAIYYQTMIAGSSTWVLGLL